MPDVEHVLAVRGAGGYRQYRIPALAVSRQGTLLAAYDGRPNLDDLPNPIDLLLRRSTDNGRTWGSQQVVRTGVGLNGYGDPSLLVDADTGRIFMFHAAGTHAGFFEAVAGMAPDDQVQHCDLSFSDDDGLTWQHRRITAELKLRPPTRPGEPAITGIFAAAGQGIQIHTGPFRGRLVQQYVVLAGGEIMAASAFSDDHGESWTLGELIGAGTHGFSPNENKVAALADGRLLLHSRGTPRRLAATSDDGGATWSALVPVEDLPDPGDNGSLVRFDGLPSVTSFAAGATDSWLLATNNQDTALRRNTVLSLSTDNGRSWPAKLVLCPGSSAYSTATRLPDGNIGVLYERQGYREIVFVSVPAGQLTAQLTAGPSDHGDAPGPDGTAGLVFDMELRSITPGRPPVWQNAGEFHVMPAGAGRMGRAYLEGNRPGLHGRSGAGDRDPRGAGPELRPHRSGLQGRGHPRLHRPGAQRRGPAGNRRPAVRARARRPSLPRTSAPARKSSTSLPATPSPRRTWHAAARMCVFEVTAGRGTTAVRRRRAFRFDTRTGGVSAPE